MAEGNPHFTDVTNAHRTSLLDLRSLKWSDELANIFGLERLLSCLPTVHPSVSHFGKLKDTSLRGVPITAILGDQHASLLGHGCVKKGMVKNTYGTGCFVLCNIGERPMVTTDGLICTVAYQLGPDQPPMYALEAPIASGGSAFRWLQNVGLLKGEDCIGRVTRISSCLYYYYL